MRITDSLRRADIGRLLLELIVLIVGILLALAVDRWNLDRLADFYFKTELADETVMGVRFDFEKLAADRNLKYKVFDAVDIHSDWLRLQNSIYEITRQIDAHLGAH